MRKWMIKFLVPSLCFMAPFAESANCKFDIGAGYRQDRLEWELAGPDDVPTVMSKLTWKNLRIFDVEAQFRKITCYNLYFRGNADYGWIFDGDNTDSDYRAKNRRDRAIEYSRSNNNAGKGQVYDASAGLGYFIRWCKLRFAPLGGYSIHEQHLHLYNGYQSIDLDEPHFEGHHFPGLNSTYNTRWHGPWAGLDMYYHINDQITLSGTFEYHWLHYRAKGNWNLRQDILGDFIHTGFGDGYFGTLSLDYNFCSGWYLGALCKLSYAHLNNGKDKTVIGIPITNNPGENHSRDEDGGNYLPFVTEGKLRNVKWVSFCFLFTAGYNF